MNTAYTSLSKSGVWALTNSHSFHTFSSLLNLIYTLQHQLEYYNEHDISSLLICHYYKRLDITSSSSYKRSYLWRKWCFGNPPVASLNPINRTQRPDMNNNTCIDDDKYLNCFKNNNSTIGLSICFAPCFCVSV